MMLRKESVIMIYISRKACIREYTVRYILRSEYHSEYTMYIEFLWFHEIWKNLRVLNCFYLCRNGTSYFSKARSIRPGRDIGSKRAAKLSQD
jgi:hypothetical protein